MSKKTDAVWKSESVVAYYLERKGSRPFLREQIDVMLTVIKGIGCPGSIISWISDAVMESSLP